jgi:hypothetical protein
MAGFCEHGDETLDFPPPKKKCFLTGPEEENEKETEILHIISSIFYCSRC